MRVNRPKYGNSKVTFDGYTFDSKRGIFIEDVLDKTITADNIMDYDK